MMWKTGKTFLPEVMLLLACGCHGPSCGTGVPPGPTTTKAVEDRSSFTLDDFGLLRGLSLNDIVRSKGKPDGFDGLTETWVVYKPSEQDELLLLFLPQPGYRELSKAVIRSRHDNVVEEQPLFPTRGVKKSYPLFHRLPEFNLGADLTEARVLEEQGPPARYAGFGLTWMVYELSEEEELRLHFSSDSRLSSAVVDTKRDGKVYSRTVFEHK